MFPDDPRQIYVYTSWILKIPSGYVWIFVKGTSIAVPLEYVY